MTSRPERGRPNQPRQPSRASRRRRSASLHAQGQRPGAAALNVRRKRMTSTRPTLQWSETEPAAEVQTGERLDQLLDHLSATARPDFPIAVRLQVHWCEVDILLGLPESFVYVNELEPRREHITVGDSDSDDVVGFYLLGQHHTEFERRHLIPLATARHALREFFNTGRRSPSLEWEESWY